jgi:hypothetical protein
MLPWLFAVLVLLNAGIFLLGYQREKAMEPPRTPVPEGSFQIRLLAEAQLAEAQEEPQRDAGDSGDPRPDHAVVFEVTAGESPTAESPQSETGGKDAQGQPTMGLFGQSPGGFGPAELEADSAAARVEGFVLSPSDGAKAR